MELPSYIFAQLGKRSGLAAKRKFGDKYKEEMARRGKLGGRPKKGLKQDKENILTES